MSALRELMTGLIDYAGLFPPAALEMDAAVRNYEAYLRGPDAWALGRFVVPAARLEDLAGRPFRLTVRAHRTCLPTRAAPKHPCGAARKR